MVEYKKIDYNLSESQLEKFFLKGPSPFVLANKGVYYDSHAPSMPIAPGYYVSDEGSFLILAHYVKDYGETAWKIDLGVQLSDQQSGEIGNILRANISKGTYPRMLSQMRSLLGSDSVKPVAVETHLADTYEKAPLWLGWCNWGVEEENGVVELCVGSSLESKGELYYSFTLGRISTSVLKMNKDSGGEQTYNDFFRLVKFLISNTTGGVGFTENGMNSMLIMF